MVCTFTGHRPERLPWGSDESDARCAALRTLIQRAVTQACADGFDAFLCGMARGCDMYFAEAVLAARETFPQIRLTAMIPCPTQPDAWPQADRARYARLLAACDAVCVLEPVYSDGCMLRRNRAMVDAAERVITVYDGGAAGGTAAAVRYAQRRGRELVRLWY